MRSVLSKILQAQQYKLPALFEGPERAENADKALTKTVNDTQRKNKMLQKCRKHPI